MTRSRTIVIALVALGVVIAGALAWTNYNQPSRDLIIGDVWNYRLLPEDAGADWTLSEQTVLDVSQLKSTEVATATVDVPGLKSLYTGSFVAGADNPDLNDLGVRVLLFDAAVNASAALQGETLGDGWSLIEGTVAGAEESRVWKYTDPDPTYAQSVVRVDFRVLNVIGSVSMLGTARGVPDATQALAYSATMADRMHTRAVPAALQTSGVLAAAPPDPRPYLLTPAQLAEVDTRLGDRWLINTAQLPSFTLNSDFPEAARAVLDKAGRVLGYQSYWVKGVTRDEEARTIGVLLFQQVSVYKDAEGAATGLAAMLGLSPENEIQPGPAIGDTARKWLRITDPGQNPDGQSSVIEINFRVGRYVASVQVTARPVGTRDAAIQLSGPNDALAEALATRLAENLAKAP